MGDFLIDLLRKSRLKKLTDNKPKYYSVMKHNASIPVTSIITQSSFNSSMVPGSNNPSSEDTTTTTTTTQAPTTTTTTTSTTTTTTTLPPGVYAFAMKYSTVSGTDACNQTISTTYYSNSSTLNAFSILATDPALTNAAPAGYYCLAIGCPNSLNIRWIQVGGFGSIGGAAFC